MVPPFPTRRSSDLLPVQLKEVTPAGSGSLTPTLVAVLGPLLLTTMVDVVLSRGNTSHTPTALVTPTLLCGVSVSVSLALLLVVSVSLAAVTVTVLTTLSGADALLLATTV